MHAASCELRAASCELRVNNDQVQVTSQQVQPSDGGAVGDRIAASGGGWLVEEAEARTFREAVEAARADPAAWRRAAEAARRHQSEEASSCQQMAARYARVYNHAATGESLEHS